MRKAQWDVIGNPLTSSNAYIYQHLSCGEGKSVIQGLGGAPAETWFCNLRLVIYLIFSFWFFNFWSKIFKPVRAACDRIFIAGNTSEVLACGNNVYLSSQREMAATWASENNTSSFSSFCRTILPPTSPFLIQWHGFLPHRRMTNCRVNNNKTYLEVRLVSQRGSPVLIAPEDKWNLRDSD